MAYYGKYRGIVKDTSDPECRGRIKVLCPEVLGEQLTAWALPCFPPNQFSVPKLNTLVWMEFEGGRIDNPIWTGVFYTKEQWKAKFGVDYASKLYLISPQASVEIQGDINADKKLTVEGITTTNSSLNTKQIVATGNISTTGNVSASSVSASGTVMGSNIN
jgi:hypothetical protein